MAQRAKRNLAAFMLLCGLLGICSWGFYAAVFVHELGQDWLVFYTAARAFLDGDHSLIWDGVRFTAVLNERYTAWLAHPLTLHPWVYPPSYLLLLLPFGLLPAGAALALFLAVTYAGLLAAACGLAADERQRRIYVLTVLLCPSVASTVFTGQNAFFTSALFLGGFALVERRPWLGGAVLGLLTMKPQLFLLVPVALVGARNWRGLAGAAGGAGILACASLAVFGAADWHAWYALVTGSSDLYSGWVAAGRLKGVSVFACASLLGAPAAIANLAQAAAIALAAACVFWIARRTARRELRLAALLAGTILAAPHASIQDGVLLGLAAAAFLAVAIEGELSLGAAVAAALVWVSPLFNPPSLFRIGLVTPLVLAGFLACVAMTAARDRRVATAAAQGIGDTSLA